MVPPLAPGTLIRRHGAATRIWHWINAVAIFVLIGIGARHLERTSATLLGPLWRELRPCLVRRCRAFPPG